MGAGSSSSLPSPTAGESNHGGGNQERRFGLSSSDGPRPCLIEAAPRMEPGVSQGPQARRKPPRLYGGLLTVLVEQTSGKRRGVFT